MEKFKEKKLAKVLMYLCYKVLKVPLLQRSQKVVLKTEPKSVHQLLVRSMLRLNLKGKQFLLHSKFEFQMYLSIFFILIFPRVFFSFNTPIAVEARIVRKNKNNVVDITLLQVPSPLNPSVKSLK